MVQPLEPVDNLTIVFSDVSPDRSENWDIVDGEKWKYNNRRPDASGRDKFRTSRILQRIFDVLLKKWGCPFCYL